MALQPAMATTEPCPRCGVLPAVDDFCRCATAALGGLRDFGPGTPVTLHGQFKLNFVEKTFMKLAYRRLEGKVKGFKTWAPVIGSATLVVATALRLLGQHDAAGAVEGLASATGLAGQSPVSGAELLAAGAALMGVTLKIVAAIKAARAEKPILR